MHVSHLRGLRPWANLINCVALSSSIFQAYPGYHPFDNQTNIPQGKPYTRVRLAMLCCGSCHKSPALTKGAIHDSHWPNLKTILIGRKGPLTRWLVYLKKKCGSVPARHTHDTITCRSRKRKQAGNKLGSTLACVSPNEPYSGTLMSHNTLVKSSSSCRRQKWSAEGDQSGVEIVTTSYPRCGVWSLILFLIIHNH